MTKDEKQLGVIAAISGFLSVALGAFGAHALKGTVHDTLFQAYETASHYQIIHSVTLLAVVLGLGIKDSITRISSWAFVVGIVLFCGSLYAMATTEIRSLGMITPFGGIDFLIGWAALAMSIWKR